MGFGHRVYRAYDPRAAALREVAEAMDQRPDWLDLAIKVEDVVLRVLAELKPGRVLKTNVEYYAAAVLQGVGLTPDLFPATFALARHAGWTAHAIEQVVGEQAHPAGLRYTGPRSATCRPGSPPPASLGIPRGQPAAVGLRPGVAGGVASDDRAGDVDRGPRARTGPTARR